MLRCMLLHLQYDAASYLFIEIYLFIPQEKVIVFAMWARDHRIKSFNRYQYGLYKEGYHGYSSLIIWWVPKK
ncbi:hypothetical protein AB733_08915 [Photobacterium swingsii]|uniref:Uncharacterized protein n=1 Tax=Photobacterium swingsii TaxID=680026 RepID=A0A0J8VCQ0_9GAMM|nr:hypothetical protein AB733_08915 [Photobacterium swingsii]PSW23593.1 hypothetical protein C9I94_15865 [Photobacterium swingsii]